MKNFWTTATLSLILISLITLLPSFKLALTGDDFLGYWRYLQHINGHIEGNWNNLNFFFTDYGPQDTFTVIIHYFFGFDPIYYYLASFFLRILAIISFLPLVYSITNNKWAAFSSALVFAVTPTGLETTDWSFNMPSYLAIASFNLFLLSLFKSQQAKTLKSLLPVIILFPLTIVLQPIRFGFLPLLVGLYDIYLIVRYHSKKQLFWSIGRILICAALMITIIMTTSIGNSFGGGTENKNARVENAFSEIIAKNFQPIITSISKGDTTILTSIINQIGNIAYPTNIIPKDRQIFPSRQLLTQYVLPTYLAFILLFFFATYRQELTFKSYLKQKSITIIPIITGLFSLAMCYYSVKLLPYPLSTSNLIGTIIGGYFITLWIYFMKRFWQDKDKSAIFFITFSLILLAFIIPWLRNPGFVYETTGRYLIVPAVGVALVFGIFFNQKFKYSLVLLAFFIIYILLNNSISYKYLEHLSEVRDSKTTNQIRKSIPNVSQFGTNKPVVFYLQPTDSEKIYHSLIFGFPVIMGTQYNFFDVWNIMYTDKWEEVLSAYSDGKSLKRFTIPEQKVPIEDIYSFELDGNKMKNTTEETRKKLLESTK